MRIVVADDDAVFRELMRLKLEADGHEVILACDGDVAFSLVRADPPQLLILDVVMPGLDGLEVTRRLRQEPETAALPIVLLTGCDAAPEIVAGWQAGADYYITKPIMIEQLRYFIKSVQDEIEPPEPWEDSVD